MRILGLELGNHYSQTLALTWEKVVQNVQDMVLQWISRRGVSLKGKLRILN